jgi:hypothetical protein
MRRSQRYSRFRNDLGEARIDQRMYSTHAPFRATRMALRAWRAYGNFHFHHGRNRNCRPFRGAFNTHMRREDKLIDAFYPPSDDFVVHQYHDADNGEYVPCRVGQRKILVLKEELLRVKALRDQGDTSITMKVRENGVDIELTFTVVPPMACQKGRSPI